MDFSLQESGTFQLSFDLTNEMSTVGSVARRDIFLSGNFMLKLEGAQLNTPVANCPHLAADAISMMLYSPQIINTTTPSNRGFILNLGPSQPVHQSLLAAATSIYWSSQAKAGDVLNHGVLCNFSGNVLNLSAGFAPITGYVSGNAINYSRPWSDIWKDNVGTPLTKPVYLTLTFSYIKVDQ